MLRNLPGEALASLWHITMASTPRNLQSPCKSSWIASSARERTRTSNRCFAAKTVPVTTLRSQQATGPVELCFRALECSNGQTLHAQAECQGETFQSGLYILSERLAVHVLGFLMHADGAVAVAARMCCNSWRVDYSTWNKQSQQCCQAYRLVLGITPSLDSRRRV